MSTQNRLEIIRRPEVLSRFNYSNTTLHTQITEGLMIPPFSLGSRAVGWLACEIEAILLARIAGKSDAEIRRLVKALEEGRSSAG